jgi:hypothetical protein
MRPPRIEPWDPSWNIPAELFILWTILGPQRRFLIHQNEQMKGKANETPVRKHPDVSKQERLTEDNCDDSQIHWIADMSV